MLLRCCLRAATGFFTVTPRVLRAVAVLNLAAFLSGPVHAGDRDEWRAVFLGSEKVGFERTRYERDGDAVIAIRDTRITSKSLQLETRFTIRTGATGLLQSFSSSLTTGPGRTVRREGELRNGHVTLTRFTTGRAASLEKNWPADTRSPLWFEWQLPDRPLPPRTRIRYTAFDPQLDDTFTIQIKSANRRRVTLPDGTRVELLPLTVTRSDRPNEVMRWHVNLAGQVVLSETDYDGVRLQKQLVPRNKARSAADTKTLDVRLAQLVRTNRPLADGRHAKQAVFRVSGAGGLAVKLNRAPRQLAQTTVDGATELTISATELTTARRHRRMDRSYLKATRLLDFNDPGVRRMASEVAAGEFDKAKIAMKLQVAVDKLVRNRMFSSQTLPASQTLLSREGDCTEHAVLLAALLRAQRIPARVAFGFVYVDGQNGFVPHMWTEANINGEWAALDASVGRKLPGGGYIQVSHSALADDETVLDEFLTLLDLMERLQIEVIRSSNDTDLKPR